MNGPLFRTVLEIFEHMSKTVNFRAHVDTFNNNIITKLTNLDAGTTVDINIARCDHKTGEDYMFYIKRNT